MGPVILLVGTVAVVGWVAPGLQAGGIAYDSVPAWLNGMAAAVTTAMANATRH